MVRANEIVDFEVGVWPFFWCKSLFFRMLQNTLNYKSTRHSPVLPAATVAARASADAR
jgi:hypothetical protein